MSEKKTDGIHFLCNIHVIKNWREKNVCRKYVGFPTKALAGIVETFKAAIRSCFGHPSMNHQTPVVLKTALHPDAISEQLNALNFICVVCLTRFNQKLA